MSANSPISDINELHIAYILSGKNWMKIDAESKNRYYARLSQVDKILSDPAIAKAEKQALAIGHYALSKGYSAVVKKIWWTGLNKSVLTHAVGTEINQDKNPIDVLIQYASGHAKGFLGISVKSLHSKTKPPVLSNPSLDSVCDSINYYLEPIYQNELVKVIKKHKLPSIESKRKEFLDKNLQLKASLKKQSDLVLTKTRDVLFDCYVQMDTGDFWKHLCKDYLKTNLSFPPYVNCTARGDDTKNITVAIVNPVDNEKFRALLEYPVSFLKAGNNGILISAGKTKIVTIRLKYRDTPFASPIKLECS